MTTIYPPILTTTRPSFLINEGGRIYFKCEDYNEIANAQVSIVKQATNKNTLSLNKYPSQIMLTSIFLDNTIETDAKYYIEILPSDLEEGFEINTYYKVQIRYTAATAPSAPTDQTQGINSWLSANLSYFSEWSSGTIIRGISKPTLTIYNTTENLWQVGDTNFIGKLSFEDSDETDTLSSYQIILYDETKENILTNSENQYTSSNEDANSFIYTSDILLNPETKYNYDIIYKTKSGYSNKDSYSFEVAESSISALEFKATAKGDVESGSIKVTCKTLGKTLFSGSFAIARSTAESNYLNWEIMHTSNLLEEERVNYIWTDNTVESGMFYKYALQEIDTNGIKGSLKTIKDPVMVIFEDSFLTRGNQTLNLKFNLLLNSFSITVSEIKVDTINSQFPFIKRNGLMNYKQFPLSGLISTDMDEEQNFIDTETFYGNNKKLYLKSETAENRKIFLERKFREAVITFLEEDSPLLFKSQQEGNILIQLMGVSLTPKTELGRFIWDFSATAYEIDDCSIDNYKKYNIISTSYTKK